MCRWFHFCGNILIFYCRAGELHVYHASDLVKLRSELSFIGWTMKEIKSTHCLHQTTLWSSIDFSQAFASTHCRANVENHGFLVLMISNTQARQRFNLSYAPIAQRRAIICFNSLLRAKQRLAEHLNRWWICIYTYNFRLLAKPSSRRVPTCTY